jgi:Flp pilus assembly protein TadD
VAACYLGMTAKETMVVAPLLILLYDRTFVAGTFRAAWQRHGRLHLALASAWLALAFLMGGSEQRGGTVGFGLGITAPDYLLTQCRALVLYLKLALWPYPLVLDYGTDVETRLAAVWPQAALLVLLAAATIVALRRAPAPGFLGAMFFALLAPSSSFVPLTTQTISEHRFYLPLALVVVALVAGAPRLFRGGHRGLWAIPAVALALLTHARNTDYRSELSIWTDTVAKVPHNARARNNLGLALFHGGRTMEAQAHYTEALRLAPAYSPAHANLGDALAAAGRPAEAMAAYEMALRVTPELDAVRRKLAQLRHAAGVTALRAGNAAEAVAHLAVATSLAPDDAALRNNLGTALLGLGRRPEARAEFEAALRLQPGYARARDNLARLDGLEKMPDGKN